MFQQQRVPVWALAAVAVLILVGVSSIANNAGWWDGYQVGLLTSAAGGGKVAPQLLHQGGWGYHHGGFGFFGGFFRFLFFLFFLGLIAKFLGFGRWRRHHGGQPWHWQQHSHPHGPWGQGEPPATPGQQSPAPQAQANPPTAASEPGANNPQPVVWV